MHARPAHALHRRLAGIPFRVQCADHRLCDVDLHGYEEFRSAATPRAAAGEIVVDCRVAPIAAEAAGPVVDGGGWGFFAERGAAHFFAPLPQTGLPPRWRAHIAPGGRRVDLECARQLLRGRGAAATLPDPLRYPLDQIALVRALDGEGLLLHAAAAVVGGKAVVFCGASGAGKTTLARLLADAGRLVLSDDRVVVRRTPRGFAVWGTPWPGEGGFARNARAPLAALCWLRQGSTAALRPLQAQAAVAALVAVASVPWYDPPACDGPFTCLEELARTAPSHDFTFRPDRDAVRLVDDVLAR